MFSWLEYVAFATFLLILVFTNQLKRTYGIVTRNSEWLVGYIIVLTWRGMLSVGETSALPIYHIYS